MRFLQDMEINKLDLDGTPKAWRKIIYRRVAALPPNKIARMERTKQIGMYAVYLHELLPELVDTVIDTLVATVRKFKRKADSYVNGTLTKGTRLRDKLW